MRAAAAGLSPANRLRGLLSDPKSRLSAAATLKGKSVTNREEAFSRVQAACDAR
eukprot:CAMPEP_0118859316 /NCGR_PEP_ID=MMETSP1163-20130328/5614_1 /TAXON_ID=124430 /ORGANISM="Phaeomonas parva, Strain CCMP2877" /LENGTH=53 /DNA_ID=CAMNT_0006792881 /DNA_START=124 /DNA_END=281 /DNA_ORIENTATION=-